MAGETIKLNGFRELDARLGELKKSTERSRLRRVAVAELAPVIERARQLAPVDDGDLRDSLNVGGPPTRSLARERRRERPDGVTVSAGSANRNAVPREFGTVRSAAHPFLRPAWDSRTGGMLDRIGKALWAMIERDARKAAKGGK